MNVPIIDAEQIAMLRDMPGDAGGTFLDELLDLFFSNSVSLMEEIRSAAACNDLKRTAAAAHTLKGSSANIGALSLHERAGEVEAAAKRGEPADAQALQNLQDEFERTRVALEKERTPAS